MASGSTSGPMNDGDELGRPAFATGPPIRVDDALRAILSEIEPVPTIELEILDCLGLVLANDVIADVDVPSFQNSAMDGYAVRCEDTLPVTPTHQVALAIVSTIPSGVVSHRIIGPGEAARIMTGAPVPSGADAVIRQEDVVTERGDRVRLSRQVRSGENVRPAGEDIKAGAVVLAAGTVLDPVSIGVLASLGKVTALVHDRPVVGILSTGDEVVPLGKPLRPGQIRDSNGSLLTALVMATGGEPFPLGIARDELSDVRSHLHQPGAEELDLILCSGGVSVGDFDMVKAALEAEGEIDCWQLLIKPGKPLAFGQVNGVPFLGLPGNPVAAYVGFLEFGLPLIRKLLGHRDLSLPEVTARLAADCDGAGDRRHFLRGRLRWDDGWVAEPVMRRGSGVLSSMLEADCLIVIPEECERQRAGDEVTVQVLRPDRAATMAATRSTRPYGQ